MRAKAPPPLSARPCWCDVVRELPSLVAETPGIYALLWAVDHNAITHSREIDKFDSSSNSVLASQMIVRAPAAQSEAFLHCPSMGMRRLAVP